MKHGQYALFVMLMFIISYGVFSIAPAYATSSSVTIPSGSSVPGCEETNACWIPAQVTVDVGGTVTWSNCRYCSTYCNIRNT